MFWYVDGPHCVYSLLPPSGYCESWCSERGCGNTSLRPCFQSLWLYPPRHGLAGYHGTATFITLESYRTIFCSNLWLSYVLLEFFLGTVTANPWVNHREDGEVSGERGQIHICKTENQMWAPICQVVELSKRIIIIFQRWKEKKT